MSQLDLGGRASRSYTVTGFRGSNAGTLRLQLEPQDGAVKAIGELDLLLEWMETYGDGRK